MFDFMIEFENLCSSARLTSGRCNRDGIPSDQEFKFLSSYMEGDFLFRPKERGKLKKIKNKIPFLPEFVKEYEYRLVLTGGGK